MNPALIMIRDRVIIITTTHEIEPFCGIPASGIKIISASIGYITHSPGHGGIGNSFIFILNHSCRYEAEMIRTINGRVNGGAGIIIVPGRQPNVSINPAPEGIGACLR